MSSYIRLLSSKGIFLLAITASTVSEARGQFAEAIQLGMGWDTARAKPKNFAVKVPQRAFVSDLLLGDMREKAPDAPDSAAKRVYMRIKEVKSLEQLREAVGVSVMASAKSLAGSLQLEADYRESSEYKSSSVYFAVQCLVTLEPITIDPGSGDYSLRDDSLKAIKANPDSYQQMYGDSYIKSVTVGGMLTAVVEYKAEERAKSDAFRLKASAAFGGFSASAEVKSTFDSTSLKSDTDVQLYCVGGECPQFVDWSNLVSQVQKYPATVASKPWVLGIETGPLAETSNWPRVKAPVQTILDTILKELTSKLDEAVQRRNDIQFALRHPAWFEELSPTRAGKDAAAEEKRRLVTLQTTHQGLISKLRKAIIRIYNTSDEDAYASADAVEPTIEETLSATIPDINTSLYQAQMLAYLALLRDRSSPVDDVSSMIATFALKHAIVTYPVVGADGMVSGTDSFVPLHEAVRGGNAAVVKAVLDSTNANPIQADRYGRTSFHILAEAGQSICLPILMSRTTSTDALSWRAWALSAGPKTPLELCQADDGGVATANALRALGAKSEYLSISLLGAAIRFYASEAQRGDWASPPQFGGVTAWEVSGTRPFPYMEATPDPHAALFNIEFEHPATPTDNVYLNAQPNELLVPVDATVTNVLVHYWLGNSRGAFTKIEQPLNTYLNKNGHVHCSMNFKREQGAWQLSGTNVPVTLKPQADDADATELATLVFGRGIEADQDVSNYLQDINASADNPPAGLFVKPIFVIRHVLQDDKDD